MKAITQITLHYVDGTSDRIGKALIGRITAAGDVLIHPVGLDGSEVMTILAGLEVAAGNLSGSGGK